ncbi:YncE family protein [Nesterenkonia sphaerica]|uniref:YncE family protein n=1 Tax=Nesterenkonia sphaerica TaxID=1804988 RepID=A0A5R9ALJ4_9MICC|nr:YncE family protein [Nesterenkonia sphaerica]TLP79463.1 YncE family protein [Nesterenkonia sphaerica]
MTSSCAVAPEAPEPQSAPMTVAVPEAEYDTGSPTGDAPADQEPGETSLTEAHPAELPRASSTSLEPVGTISEPAMSPKSVVANDHGLAIANNMMYHNSVTVYDTRTGDLIQELPGSVSPSSFGLEGYPDTVQGAPVEATWTADGEYAYVSQYRLAGLGAAAYDDCRNGSAVAPSAVFRYSVQEEGWDQFIEVGRVPKAQALTPDESRLLVTNWCDFDLSVIETATGVEERRVPLSSQPRGIAVMPDNRTAYVAAMYANELWKVDLDTGSAEVIHRGAELPRHLVLSPESDVLYVTFSRSDLLLAFDTSTDEVIHTADTGREARTMDISADGTALYVVNYFEDTVSKFDAGTLEEIDRRSTGHRPIGVTYDASTGSVWVANYSGSITVFDDTALR